MEFLFFTPADMKSLKAYYKLAEKELIHADMNFLEGRFESFDSPEDLKAFKSIVEEKIASGEIKGQITSEEL